jgi:hypothetical protein
MCGDVYVEFSLSCPEMYKYSVLYFTFLTPDSVTQVNLAEILASLRPLRWLTYKCLLTTTADADL